MTPSRDYWLCATHLFDGYTLPKGRALHIVDGSIVTILPTSQIPGKDVFRTLTGIICPGFFDIQINGGGNVLFNTSPTREGLFKIAATHRVGGTMHWLPTVITDVPDVLETACTAILESYGEFGIAGIHIEGPHISLAGIVRGNWLEAVRVVG